MKQAEEEARRYLKSVTICNDSLVYLDDEESDKYIAIGESLWNLKREGFYRLMIMNQETGSYYWLTIEDNEDAEEFELYHNLLGKKVPSTTATPFIIYLDRAKVNSIRPEDQKLVSQ